MTTSGTMARVYSEEKNGKIVMYTTSVKVNFAATDPTAIDCMCLGNSGDTSALPGSAEGSSTTDLALRILTIAVAVLQPWTKGYVEGCQYA